MSQYTLQVKEKPIVYSLLIEENIVNYSFVVDENEDEFAITMSNDCCCNYIEGQIFGVLSVTSNPPQYVDNTDPRNPIINFQLILDILAEISPTESDPIFEAWLDTNPLADFLTEELDPVFSAWLLTNPIPTLVSQLTNDAGYLTSVTTPTLQEVLDNNHDLVDGNNFQGTDAGIGNIGLNIVAFGNESAMNNTGNKIISMGSQTLNGNSGNNIIALGHQSLGGIDGNTSDNVNAFGFRAGLNNLYKNVNLFGFLAEADADNQTVFSKWVSGVTKYLGRLSFTSITENRKWFYINYHFNKFELSLKW